MGNVTTWDFIVRLLYILGEACDWTSQIEIQKVQTFLYMLITLFPNFGTVASLYCKDCKATPLDA